MLNKPNMETESIYAIMDMNICVCYENIPRTIS